MCENVYYELDMLAMCHMYCHAHVEFEKKSIFMSYILDWSSSFCESPFLRMD